MLRATNIIFVCGGNDKTQLRPQFAEYCGGELAGFEVFYPEFAMPTYFDGPVDEPFDIADFETLIGELSHAIVVFPEAPGSFAETGYFSAVEPLYKKTVLVLDEKYQGKDSFLSMGPAKKISEKSIYNPVVQLNYEKPDFGHVRERIERVKVSKYRKTLDIKEFSELSSYAVFCLLQRLVDLMGIATADDVIQVVRALSLNRFSPIYIRKMLSIMVGADYLRGIGRYGHLSVNPGKPPLVDVKEGHREQEAEIRLRLADVYEDYDPEFLAIVEQARNAD
jgi:hypothetical protein